LSEQGGEVKDHGCCNDVDATRQRRTQLHASTRRSFVLEHTHWVDFKTREGYLVRHRHTHTHTHTSTYTNVDKYTHIHTHVTFIHSPSPPTNLLPHSAAPSPFLCRSSAWWWTTFTGTRK
jgi:hypothetical protein